MTNGASKSGLWVNVKNALTRLGSMLTTSLVVLGFGFGTICLMVFVCVHTAIILIIAFPLTLTALVARSLLRGSERTGPDNTSGTPNTEKISVGPK